VRTCGGVAPPCNDEMCLHIRDLSREPTALDGGERVSVDMFANTVLPSADFATVSSMQVVRKQQEVRDGGKGVIHAVHKQ